MSDDKVFKVTDKPMPVVRPEPEPVPLDMLEESLMQWRKPSIYRNDYDKVHC